MTKQLSDTQKIINGVTKEIIDTTKDIRNNMCTMVSQAPIEQKMFMATQQDILSLMAVTTQFMYDMGFIMGGMCGNVKQEEQSRIIKP